MDVVAGQMAPNARGTWRGASSVWLNRFATAVRPGLVDATAELRFLMDALPAAIARVSAGREILSVNRLFEDWFVTTDATVLGKPLDEVLGSATMRKVEHQVTVALGGDGGDELFAGYDPFKALGPATWYRRLVPGWAHKRVRSLAELLPVSERNMGLDFKIKRGLRGVSYPESAWNPAWLGALDPSELQELFRQPVHHEDVFEEAIAAWNNSAADNPVDKTLEFYTRFYLQDDILTKVDRASMMVSLEVRAPFLDNDVVDFARRIPHQYKFRDGQTKYLLKRALEGILPRDIIHRKKKGFGVPLTRWLKDLQEPDTALRAPAIDAAWVDRKWREHRAGKADHRLFLWCWIVLQTHLCNVAG